MLFELTEKQRQIALACIRAELDAHDVPADKVVGGSIMLEIIESLSNPRSASLTEMRRYLPVLERAEADPEIWVRLTEGLGIATVNGYRHALESQS